ncbi:MAG TPA: CPBP family intramembrane glutamic endopeptidase, partial [Gemmataceae bacterium]|nr:CPBP family intramembrane glutamic endopeptidase [Gemmataceae bacterium]
EAWWQYLLALAVLPAVCEELAFRGLILAGLRQRFRPWTAILLSSLLFALYHMNVFQLLPAFAFGVVLGLLAVRSGSVLPGMLLHLLHNGLLVGLMLLQSLGHAGKVPAVEWLRPAAAVVCTLLAAAVLWRLARRKEAAGVEPASVPPKVAEQVPREPVQV